MVAGKADRSSGAGATLRAPGLAFYGRAAPKAGRLLRESQAHQQRHGQAWSCEYLSV